MMKQLIFKKLKRKLLKKKYQKLHEKSAKGNKKLKDWIKKEKDPSLKQSLFSLRKGLDNTSRSELSYRQKKSFLKNIKKWKP